MLKLFWVPNFIEIGHIAILRPNLPKFLISSQDRQFQISYLWLTNLTSSDCQILNIGNIFHFCDKFSWNEGIDNCFNVECLLLDCNFDFLGDYLVVTARYLVVNAGYCSLPSGYCWLQLVSGGYRSLLLVTGRSHF